MAKVLIINSSPHLTGNTVAMIDSFKHGLEKNNISFTQYNIAFMNIHDSIGTNSEEIDDDMQRIYPALRESEYVLFASPLYFYSFSGYLKNFIDRLSKVQSIEKKKLIVFIPMASDNKDVIKPLYEQTKLICNHLSWELLDFVYLPSCVNQKDYLNHLSELEKAFQIGLKIN